VSIINRIPEELQDDIDFYNTMMRNNKDLLRSRHPEDRREILKQLRRLEKEFRYWLGELSISDIDLVDGIDKELTELLDHLKLSLMV
jgi:hypothetical protein